MLKKTLFSTLCLASLLLSSAAYAQRQPDKLINVGVQPLAVMPDSSGNIHVLCNGADNNFNGIFEADSGDIRPSWYVLDHKTGNVLRSRTLDHYLQFPLRAGIAANLLVLPNGKKVEVYNAATQQLIDSALFTMPDSLGTITAVTPVTVSNKNEIAGLMISSRKNFTSPGYFSLLSEKGSLRYIFPVGINPQHSVTAGQDENMILAVICEGAFGAGNSKVYVFFPPEMGNNPVIDSFDVGDTGNYLVVADNLLLAISNGSHKIVAYDLDLRRVLGEFPTGTTGFDGPREGVVIPSEAQLYLTTYSSDLRIGSILDGSQKGAWNTKGKPEGIVYSNNAIWVANAYKSGAYTYDSTVAMFSMNTSSVQEYMNNATGQGIMIQSQNEAVTVHAIAAGNLNMPEFQVMDIRGNCIAKAPATISTNAMGAQVLQATLPMQGNSTGLYMVQLPGSTVPPAFMLWKR
jgi:hypothetical protein